MSDRTSGAPLEERSCGGAPPTARNAARRAPAAPNGLRPRRRALVVDDNDAAREALRKLLLAEGFECDAATSGGEALAHLAGRPPSDPLYDIIFVDIIMPGMDGLELVREIRTQHVLPASGRGTAEPDASGPAIVVVTGVDDVSRASEALRLGADEYVVKPYSMSQLRLAWGQAFERRRQFGEQKRAERTRDEVTELIFHDLRSPLTAARGYLGLMQAAPDAVGPGDIAAAAHGCDLAVDIIEHGEDLGRIERSEIEVKKGSLRLEKSVPALVEDLRPLAEGAGKRIRVACTNDLPAVVGDAFLVKRVASVLLAGAIKYASGRGDIVAELSASGDRSEVLFAVTDDGLPVTREFREAIFDKHRQGELRWAGSRRGRGLALPFAREACRRMGARIWVEDAEVRPPVSRPTSRQTGEVAAPQAASRRAGCRFVVAFRAASTSGAEPGGGASPCGACGEGGEEGAPGRRPTASSPRRSENTVDPTVEGTVQDD